MFQDEKTVLAVGADLDRFNVNFRHRRCVAYRALEDALFFVILQYLSLLILSEVCSCTKYAPKNERVVMNLDMVVEN